MHPLELSACTHTHTHTPTQSISTGAQSRAVEEDITCHCGKARQLSHTPASPPPTIHYGPVQCQSLLPSLISSCRLITGWVYIKPKQSIMYCVSVYSRTTLTVIVSVLNLSDHICFADPQLLPSYLICFLISLCYVVSYLFVLCAAAAAAILARTLL